MVPCVPSNSDMAVIPTNTGEHSHAFASEFFAVRAGSMPAALPDAAVPVARPIRVAALIALVALFRVPNAGDVALARRACVHASAPDAALNMLKCGCGQFVPSTMRSGTSNHCAADATPERHQNDRTCAPSELYTVCTAWFAFVAVLAKVFHDCVPHETVSVALGLDVVPPPVKPAFGET